MNTGNILVSVMTNPDLFPALKKASAVVTDVGGLSCHAAIVARELCIPCIIGTKHASKILKTGDKVLIDANTGIVTIVNKAEEKKT
jgi:pyruvate,water dikinase